MTWQAWGKAVVPLGETAEVRHFQIVSSYDTGVRALKTSVGASARPAHEAPGAASVQAAPSPSLGRTLEALDQALRYRDWIFSAAAPHLRERVLEVGAGSGTLTQCVAGRELVVALEIEPAFAEHLRRRFTSGNVDVVEGSATDRALLQRVAKGRVDSAMSFNVLEHIPDDVAVLQCVHDILPPGGRFVAFVRRSRQYAALWIAPSATCAATLGATWR